MPDQLQLRGGTTVQHSTFTGASKEVTVDTTKKTAVVHDGSTVGGNPLMREDASNSALALGSAAAPSLKFTGDPNTGIYSPGADQLAVATNGVQRLYIDSTGSIGVGTTTKAWESGQYFAVQFGKGGAVFGRAAGDEDRNGFVSNAYHDAASWKYIASSAHATRYEQSDGNHLWYYAAPGTADASVAFSEAMRITSAGLVGIGASSPNATLDIESSSGTAVKIRLASNTSNRALTFSNAAETIGWTVGNGVIASARQFVVYDNEAGAARLLIDSSGRVGIGVTTPADTLHVRGPVSGTILNLDRAGSYSWKLGQSSGSDLTFTGDTSERVRFTSDGKVLVGTSSAFSTSSNALIQAVNTSGGEIVIGRDFALGSGSTIGRLAFFTKPSAVAEAARIEAVADAVHSGGAPTRLVFSTTADGASSPTERMRISNGGQISQFSDTGWENIRVSSASAAGTTRTFYSGYHSATGVNTGTLSYRVYTNGNVQNTNNSYGAISDIKLKENIVDANSQWDDLKALQVRNYNFKEGQTHTQIGLVAQEVELVSPGLVSESPDRDEDGNDLGTVTKSVNYSVLYMKAVKALQEAIGRIETLEAEVAALKAP
jgi:hypothetical protein